MVIYIGCDGYLPYPGSGLVQSYSFYSMYGYHTVSNILEDKIYTVLTQEAWVELVAYLEYINPHHDDVVLMTWGGPEFYSIRRRVDIEYKNAFKMKFNFRLIDLQTLLSTLISYPSLKRTYSKLQLGPTPTGVTSEVKDAFRILSIHQYYNKEGIEIHNLPSYKLCRILETVGLYIYYET